MDAELVLPAIKGKAKPGPLAPVQDSIEESQQAPAQARNEALPLATIAPVQVLGRADGPPLRQGKVALNFRLDPELHQLLRMASHRTDISIQQIVETAVRQYLGAMAL